LVAWGVGEGEGAGLGWTRGWGERVAAGGAGDEEGPLAGESADGERSGRRVGKGECLGVGLAGGGLGEVEDGLIWTQVWDEVAGDLERG